MMRTRLKIPVQGLAGIIVGTVLVVWAFPRAIEDWQFQLAGLADPLLGRPAPAITIILGAVASVVVVATVLVLGRAGRWRALLSWWILPLLAGWVAYGSGAALTLAGGGQVSYAGTLRYELGAPVTHQATVPAACRTPVGKPTILAEVRPTIGNGTPAVGGLPMLWFREAATGEARRFGPGAELIASGPGDGSALAPFDVPNLPVRALPYLEASQGDGPPSSEPPIHFLAAYHYALTRLEDHGLSGIATIVATRWEDPYGGGGLRWVNLRIPNDPWPETFEVSITWSC